MLAGYAESDADTWARFADFGKRSRPWRFPGACLIGRNGSLMGRINSLFARLGN
jgi:hypothetical protein